MKIGFIALKNILLGKNFTDLWKSEKELNAYKRLYTCPNLSLLTVAGLTESSIEVKYIDENISTIDFDEDFDIVCLSPVAQQINNAYETAKRFRERGVTVVIGGIHATVEPEEVKEHADSVIIGEAEGLWEQFLDDFREGRTKEFYRREPGNVVDLTKTPPPRYDILPDPKYYKVISVQVTRGCPHDCEFCASAKLYGLKYRHKSVEQVVNEIKMIKEIWKNPYIYFTDDNMLVLREFSKELLRALIPLKIRWYAFSDISIADDEELLALLFKSGCTQMTIGLESLTPANLESLNKNNWKLKQLKRYPEMIAKIQSHGIGVFGSFVVGLDNDSTEVFKNVRDFVLDNNLFGTSFSVLTPFPGTRLYSRLSEEGRILDDNWDNYTCFDVVFEPRNMSIKELEEGFRWLYEEIYSPQVTSRRMRYFANIISELRNKT